MAWFEHKHWWRRTSELQKVTTSEAAKKAEFCFFLEQCACGAVRTIELRPGEAPVIRMGKTDG